MKKSLLQDLAKQLASLVPAQFDALKKDFETNCHLLLMKTFHSLEVVTREEFDAQTKVLGRTRKKLETLEAKLEALETSLTKKKNPK